MLLQNLSLIILVFFIDSFSILKEIKFYILHLIVHFSDHACLEKQEFTCKSEIGSPAGSVEDLSASEMVNSMDSSKLSKMISNDQCEEYVNAQGVRFTPLQPQGPYGSVCIRELFSFLVTICQPLDKTNTEVMIHVGLSLLQKALEISADAISKFSSLLAIAKDQLCRNLIYV